MSALPARRMLICRGAPGMRQRGVALAVVVWFIAGLSLLVAGLVVTARTDTRLASVHLSRAQVTAAGDGAIRLLMSDLLDGRFRAGGGAGNLLPQAQYRVGDKVISVLAVPEQMLVNLNSATPADLAALAELSGVGSSSSSQAVARAVVQYRNRGSGTALQLNSLEDLLNVPGVNRVTLEALRDFVTVTGGAGSSLRGPSAGNGQARNLVQLQQLRPRSRARQENLLAPNPVGPAQGVAGGAFRVDALVREDRDVWLRRRWIRLGGGRDGFPWAVLRTEPVRMVPRAK